MMSALGYSKQQLLTPAQEKLFKQHPELVNKDGSFDLRRARALFYKPELIEKVIASREAGLSPRQSFRANGLDKTIFEDWQSRLKDDDCPLPIKYLFASILLVSKDDRYLPPTAPIPLYYKSQIVNIILKYKRAGLSDEAAFKGAGVYVSTYRGWRREIKEDPECPKKLKDLFRDMAKAEAKIMADVVSIVVEEAVENKNWKAASDLMPRLWRNEFGAHPVPEQAELLAPTFNLDDLSREEQEIFIRLSKKCRIVDEASALSDSKVKLLISLPDNGR